MNSLDRRRLRENYVELVRNLNPEDVTDYLYQEQILSDEDCENIFSGATRAQRMRLFLALLPKKGPNSYSKFITAMQQSGYDYLVEILTNTPLDPDEIDAESVAPDSPPILLQEIRLHTLKEKLEHQSEVVKSMQSEMKQLQEELKRQSQSFEGNEKYKRTVTVLNELEKEKQQEAVFLQAVYEALLQAENTTKEDEKTSSKVSRKSSSAATAISRTSSLRMNPSVSHRHHAKIKCVLIGDGSVGKTSIIHYFINKQSQPSYVPTIFDNRSVDVTHGHTLVSVNFWDTAGQDAYDRLRPLSYSDAHVALLVFNVQSQISLNNVLAKWHPELKHYCRKVPYILVGNKTDPIRDPEKLNELRRDGHRLVESKECHKAAQVIRASSGKAFLCSALNGDGIDLLLEYTTEIGLKYMLKTRKSAKAQCTCM